MCITFWWGALISTLKLKKKTNKPKKTVIHSNTKPQFLKTELEIIKAPYLNPAYADAALKQLLDGTGEEQCDGEPHSSVQRHRHKHTAG